MHKNVVATGLFVLVLAGVAGVGWYRTTSRGSECVLGERDHIDCAVEGSLSLSTLARLGARIDVNAASAEDLARLRGIGPKRAAAIVGTRDVLGGYCALAELTRVRGIGPATVQRLERQLSIVPAIRCAAPGQK